MAVNASRDKNNVPTRLAVLNTDPIQGLNRIQIAINSADNSIQMNTTDTISFTMQPIDPRDWNYVGCWLFKGLDGKVYPAVANSIGELLVTT